MVKRSLPRFEEELLAGREVAIVVVVIAIAVIPARASEDAMLLADDVVYADRVGEIFDRLHKIGLPEITHAIWSTRRYRFGQIGLHEIPGNGVDQSGGKL